MASGTIQKNMVLLWENPNPSASFAAQTISLDLSAYDCIAVKFTRGSGDTVGFQLGIFRVGDSNLRFFALTSLPFKISLRAINQITQTGVDFGDASTVRNYADSFADPANNTAIPYQIFGIKA